MNKRKMIKTFMKEKNNEILLGCDVTLYYKEDFDKIDSLSSDNIKGVYEKIFYQNEGIFGDENICPQCAIVLRNCGACTYKDFHGHCISDFGSTYQKIIEKISSDDYESILDFIGGKTLKLFFKWNRRII